MKRKIINLNLIDQNVVVPQQRILLTLDLKAYLFRVIASENSLWISWIANLIFVDFAYWWLHIFFVCYRLF